MYRRRCAIVLLAGLSAAALTGCSGSSSSSEASPSQTPASPTASPTPTETVTETATATATATPTDSLCTEEAIMAAIPEGSEMVKYNCADVSGTQWAAVEVKPGPTVFFLQASGDTWDVSTSDEVCGTASAGLPPELLDYCSDVESGG